VYGRVDVMLRASDQRALRARDQHHPRHDQQQPPAESRPAVGIEFPDLCARIIELSLEARP
jgi:D-alanine-D-alanine ligase